MRSVKTLIGGLVVVLALGALAAGGAEAKMSRLLLKSGGKAVAAGSPAGGLLAFGPCGSFTSTGVLSGNDLMVDKAEFTKFEAGAGGCGEGGPTITGKLTGIDVSANGVLTAIGELNYKTQVPKSCDYTLMRLSGKFTVPGQTKAEVSGVGKRVKSASEKGCTGTLHVSHAQAELYGAASGEPYEAEEG